MGEFIKVLSLLPATGVVTALSKGGATMFGGGAGDKG